MPDLDQRPVRPSDCSVACGEQTDALTRSYIGDLSGPSKTPEKGLDSGFGVDLRVQPEGFENTNTGILSNPWVKGGIEAGLAVTAGLLLHKVQPELFSAGADLLKSGGQKLGDTLDVTFRGSLSFDGPLLAVPNAGARSAVILEDATESVSVSAMRRFELGGGSKGEMGSLAKGDGLSGRMSERERYRRTYGIDGLRVRDLESDKPLVRATKVSDPPPQSQKAGNQSSPVPRRSDGLRDLVKDIENKESVWERLKRLSAPSKLDGDAVSDEARLQAKREFKERVRQHRAGKLPPKS
jgi:hypothetical protein